MRRPPQSGHPRPPRRVVTRVPDSLPLSPVALVVDVMEVILIGGSAPRMSRALATAGRGKLAMRSWAATASLSLERGRATP
jgi:hypothetical protein